MENNFPEMRGADERSWVWQGWGLKANSKCYLDVHLTWPFGAPFPGSRSPPERCQCLLFAVALFTLRFVFSGEIYFTNYYVSATVTSIRNWIKAVSWCQKRLQYYNKISKGSPKVLVL